MKIAIHQPNYLPWCGYFSKMKASDCFVFLDSVEISPGQSYVYRTKILTIHGTRWLSVPCHRPSSALINNVEFAGTDWANKHLRIIEESYKKMAFFHDIFSILEPIYRSPGVGLSDFNIRLIISIAEYLHLPSKLYLSSHLSPQGKGDDRLISLCTKLGADVYISGKGGANYQNPAKFENAEIKLEVMEYHPIPYAQDQEGFEPGLSILDVLFRLGPAATQVLHF